MLWNRPKSISSFLDRLQVKFHIPFDFLLEPSIAVLVSRGR